MENPTENEVVAQLVVKATGVETTEIHPIVGRGMRNQIFLVTTPKDHLIVRLNDAEHLKNFKKEEWCLEAARKIGIPVPKVIECGVESGRAYSVAHFLEGSSGITSGHDRLRVWKTLGNYARKLNSIPDRGESKLHFLEQWETLITEDLDLAFCTNYWTENGNLNAAQLVKLKQTLE